MFVFGDFNVHHKDWLTYSSGTDGPGERCNNLPDCDSHSPALLDSFLSSDADICSTRTFPSFGNSDVVVSVSNDFQ